MHTRKSVWLGSLSLLLAIATTPAWAQNRRGVAGGAGKSFTSSTRGDAQPRSTSAAAAEDNRELQRPGTEAPHLARDYRHHSLEQDAERAHERRQRHHEDATQPAVHQAALEQ